MSLRVLLRKYICHFNFIILLAFTFQNSAAILLMSYTQQRHRAAEDAGKRFSPLHALTAIELTKMICSAVWAAFDIAKSIRVRPTRWSLAAGDPSLLSKSSAMGTTSVAAPTATKASCGGSATAAVAVVVNTDSSGADDDDACARWQHDSVVGVRDTGKDGGEVAVPVTHIRRAPASAAVAVAVAVTGGDGGGGGGVEKHGVYKSLPTRRSGGWTRSDFAIFRKHFLQEALLFYVKRRRSLSSEEDSSSGEEGGGGGPAVALKRRRWWRRLRRLCRRHINLEALYMAVPAIAYAVQNLFMMDALSKLNPLVYQITVQVRILMVALTMRVVMKTAISRRQWMALCVLFFGVVLGQLGAAPGNGPQPQRQKVAPPWLAQSGGGGGEWGLDASLNAAPSAFDAQDSASADAAGGGGMSDLYNEALLGGAWGQPDAALREERVPAGAPQATPAAAAASASALLSTAAVVAAAGERANLAVSARFLSGLTSLLIGCCISVFSSVYIEAIFKKRAKHVFLSMRNFHLALFSVLYTSVLSWQEYTRQRDRPRAAAAVEGGAPSADTARHDSLSLYIRGYFNNFDAFVWTLVLVNALGGLLIALLLRYSDNIMKTMSTAAAIVVSGVGSYCFFDADLSGLFLIGAALVMSAVLLYNLWK